MSTMLISQTNVHQAKLAAVSNLVQELRDDLKTPALTTSRKLFRPPQVLNVASEASSSHRPRTERDAALEELKVYGRDPRYADPLFAKEVRMMYIYTMFKAVLL